MRSDNLDLIEQALTRIFEQEGCRRIPKPSLPSNPVPVLEKLRFRPHTITPYLWVFELLVSQIGWTIIKTRPVELLCQRATGATRPRLSELAMQTGCDAFHYMVYDRYCGALLEADASGQTFASGYLDCDEKDMRFYDEPITKLSGGLYFYLLNVPLELQAVSRIPEDYEQRERKLIELEALSDQGCMQALEAESELEELKKSVFSEQRERRLKELEALSQQGWKQAQDVEPELEELRKSVFELHDEALGQTLIAPGWARNYWNLYSMLQVDYDNPQQLEADGARVLYFQPANSSGVGVAEIWEEMSRNAEPEPNISFVRAVGAKSVQLGLQDAWEYEANRPHVGWEWRKF